MPFYLRSGKRLGKRVTEIAIEFKGVPHRFFSKASGELPPNVLRLHIQPDEGVSLKFGVKIPGSVLQIQSVYMDFPYAKLGAPIAGGYERLLLDVTHGDQTLFIRGDEAEHAWEVLTPILNAWAKTAAARVSRTTPRARSVRKPPTGSSRRTDGGGGRSEKRGRKA